MSYLKQPGASVYYELWGENGPWVTLLNGHTRTLSDFKSLAKKLNEAGFRVILLDNRGSGKTQIERAFTIHEMAADVLAIWDHEGIKESRLLGISMGGAISQILISQAPQRIPQLILVSTACHEQAIQRHPEEWTTDVNDIAKKLSVFFAPEFLKKNRLLVEAMAKQMLKAMGQEDLLQRIKMQRDTLKDFDFCERITGNPVPTLIVHGREDNIVAIKWAEDLKARLPKSQLKLFPNAGHLLLAEIPREFAETVIGFFLQRTNLDSRHSRN